ncbi:YmfQ family protein [Brevundimonas sp.]|uniref:YmfQ family protein n=1 Tax=Brevundimonas sp. TaxID=1871086 RepID=UPI003F6F07EA
MATPEDYLAQLKTLLPQGVAWPQESGTVLDALLGAWAEELARADAMGAQLLVEADPRIVDQMLGDWERAYGLPDGCVVADPTIAGRRLAVHQKVASLGGQSKGYFVGVAALLGYDAEVESFRPSRLPFRVPQEILGRPWAFAWRVAIYGPTVLTDAPVYASADLECVISRASPAYSTVSFDWAPEPVPTFYCDFRND